MITWLDRTADEIEMLAARDPVAVLPLAAVEQHGPHLPVSTDVEIGRALLDRAGKTLEGWEVERPVLRLPGLVLGTSDEHHAFPGTLTLDASTLEEAVVDVGSSLARHGIRRLVVSNSHGGNKAVLDTAALRLRTGLGMLVVKAHWFRFPRPGSGGEGSPDGGGDDGVGGVEIPEAEWRHGLHGGAVETAMMLHIAPDRVRSDRVRRFHSLGEELESVLELVGPEGAAPFAWTAGDLNADGVTGDATLATPALGRRLVHHYGDVLARVIRDAARFPVERLALEEGPA